MLRKLLLTVLVALAITAVPTAAAAEGAHPPGGEGTAGPPYPFVTELVGQFGPVVPLKNEAILGATEYGYRYRAGQQDTHLVVTQTQDGLVFADTGTDRWERVAAQCKPLRVRRGIAAVCPVPRSTSAEAPLLLEIWPRLGHDFVDASTLSASFATVVLGDRGRDTARFGAGWDFFNGFTERDRVSGGAGNDWIRSGLGPDIVYGGDGDDQVIGVDGNDEFFGGNGKDRLGGGPGDDRLNGGPAADLILCDSGNDTVLGDPIERLLDRLLGCSD